MPDPDWKQKILKILKKALKDKKIDQKTYDRLKKALDAVKTVAEFVSGQLTDGTIGYLGKKDFLKWKGAGTILEIMIILVEAGPCPWTDIICARLQKLITEEMSETVPNKKLLKRLRKLKKKYMHARNLCYKKAKGDQPPKSINDAIPSDLFNIPGVTKEIAYAIVSGTERFPIFTSWDALNIPGVTMEIIENLFKAGYYFSGNSEGILELDEEQFDDRNEV